MKTIEIKVRKKISDHLKFVMNGSIIKAIMVLLALSFEMKAQITSCESKWYEGDGTYYDGVAGGESGHCAIPIAAGDIYHCAMNKTQYAGSNSCGSCVRILGPKGEVTVKVVDECPGCRFGDIDLAKGVFPQIANIGDGRVKIKWQYVPCPLAGDIKLNFAPGSGPYYFKAQVRDAFYPVSKLEYRKADGSYVKIDRVDYNYFVKLDGIDEGRSKAGPYTLRFTSFTGEVVEAKNIVFNTLKPVPTGVQFKKLNCPDCAGEMDGSAKIDFCNVCSGGNTGIVPNTNCKKDCAGYWDGNAYLDPCGKCVGGTTGVTTCGKDCNGVPGGSSYIDKCGTCVGGLLMRKPCTKDCNNDWGGTASIDSCGTCAGGKTSRTFQSNKNLCIPTGLQEMEMISEIQLHPNPFQHQVTIDVLGDFEYIIYNITGKEEESGKGNTQITIGQHLPEGVYLIKIKRQNAGFMGKLVKFR